ncbi:hypothetical protein M501DRAFT_1000399 [Patellaria atrata CBS 101060]|uniref:Uncharacterized protein n=1 Tax=Patellaria atrata CBS 101060 TaxID=1346257 RepID=A0A9P4SGB5_9PEZI|nr:hypothetical protein M501DRAFT_1000399 [Patellaria atrata CBS 101060]
MYYCVRASSLLVLSAVVGLCMLAVFPDVPAYGRISTQRPSMVVCARTMPSAMIWIALWA